MSSRASLSSKDADEILEKTVIRCKKAQAIARPFTNNKKVRAGSTVEQKMIELLKMTQEDEYGELTTELRTLANMILDMQKGVLEQLLDSVETIERRMKAYNDKVGGPVDYSDSGATSDDESIIGRHDEEDHEANIQMVSERIDQYNENNNTGGPECSTMQKRFMERLRTFFAFQRIAEDRVGIVDPLGKVR